MSSKSSRIRKKNQDARCRRAFRLRDQIPVKAETPTKTSTTPMERFLLGVSHELGFGGAINDKVRAEVVRRLDLLKQPIKQQRWNWGEAELPEGQRQLLREDDLPDKVMVCDLYEVRMRKIEPDGWPPAWWLSIKRRFTKEPVHDWRHFQKIKNELVGEENEGIELYPAESRLVDTSNQYHLFVLQDPKMRFPIGFQDRAVAAKSMLGAEQRGFDENSS